MTTKSFSEENPILKEGRLYRLKQSRGGFHDNNRQSQMALDFFYERGTILLYLGVLKENISGQDGFNKQYYHGFLDPDGNVVGIWEVWHYLRSDQGSTTYETVKQKTP